MMNLNISNARHIKPKGTTNAKTAKEGKEREERRRTLDAERKKRNIKTKKNDVVNDVNEENGNDTDNDADNNDIDMNDGIANEQINESVSATNRHAGRENVIKTQYPGLNVSELHRFRNDQLEFLADNQVLALIRLFGMNVDQRVIIVSTEYTAMMLTDTAYDPLTADLKEDRLLTEDYLHSRKDAL
jgi:hypothetical protein